VVADEIGAWSNFFSHDEIKMTAPIINIKYVFLILNKLG
jgi:hypothetical protein